MSYKVAIRKNETGEVRFHAVDSEWNEVAEFYWTEGNAACDCNRQLFFERSGKDRGESDCANVSCGESRYSCLWAEDENGTRFVLDDGSVQ